VDYYCGLKISLRQAETRSKVFRRNHVCGVKASLYRRAWMSWKLRLPEFLDSRRMEVVRLSALSTGRLYPPGIESTSGP
jgi:hypothetical protein